jgi:NAD(P)-dependent dehydrogenase (short-subunit alcohol dehydrogenase family)
MMRGELDGKVTLITGAAQGIGRCVAEFFAADGAAVMLADIQGDKVAEVAAGLTAKGHNAGSVQTDVSSAEASAEMVERTLEQYGQVDILVNVAGIDAPPGSAWEIDESHWRKVIDVDLTGQWWCAQAVLPHMMERGSGRIIFISSGSARVGDRDISVAYNAAKAGLIGLTIGLSVQVESFGILVNAVAPGSTGTGRPIDPEELATFEDELPLGVGGPEPVAHACLYLARSSGDWVSGSVMNVSGGWVRG